MARRTAASRGVSGLTGLFSGTLTLVVASMITLLALGSGVAQAATCPNQGERVGSSLGLPDCRAFEAVSPLFNEGAYTTFGTSSDVVSGDGDGLTYEAPSTAGAVTSSGGVNADYVARRTPEGWVTSPLFPSGRLFHPTAINDSTPDLGTFLFDLESLNADGTNSRNSDSYEGGAGGVNLVSVTPAGSAVGGEIGSSADLTHLFSDNVLFAVNGASSVPLVASDQTFFAFGPANEGASLVENVGAGSGASRYRLVGLDNDGRQVTTCSTQLGGGTFDSAAENAGKPFHSVYHAVSGDGSRVFFTADAPSFFQALLGQCGGSIFTPYVSGGPFPVNANQVLARVGGAQTFSLTRSSGCASVACVSASQAPVVFEGASKDGTRAFVTTTQPLLDGDTDSTSDLYECDLSGSLPAAVSPVNSCPDLIALSASANVAAPADVQGVVRVSSDGSHVYFVAHGALTTVPNARGVLPAAGDDNLYVASTTIANPNQHLAFIGALSPTDTGPSQTTPGALNGLWGYDGGHDGGDGRPAQASSDGRFLVFVTAARLTADDTDNARDVYRYDADTGTLARVSAGRNGYDADGNSPADDASIPTPGFDSASLADVDRISGFDGRVVSDDGSTVVFQTSEALVASDTNGTTDIYEWHDGAISLITDGVTKSDPPTLLGTGAVGSGSIGSFATITSIVGLTPDGRDLFIHTPDVLVPGASGSGTIYDARVNGGFPAQDTAGCTADACQGPLAATPTAPQPTSSSYTGTGNIPVPPAAKPKAIKKKPKAKKPAKKKHATKKKAKKTNKKAKRRNTHHA